MDNPNQNPPSAQQMVQQHRVGMLFQALAAARRLKVELLLLDMDGPLEPVIAEVLRREFEGLAALCLPKEAMLPEAPKPTTEGTKPS